MKQIHIFLTVLMSMCIGLIGGGIVSAQDTPVILAENYTSAPDRVVFFYPTGWVVDTQTSFVSVSDTKTTIEFYTASLSQGVIDLTNKDLEASVLSFLNILGAEEIGVVVPANQTTQVTIKEETFIGTSIVDGGQLQYIFLVKGLLMDDPGLIFIRVKGPALDLLASPDAFLTIIKSFGTFATPVGASSVPTTTTNTTDTTVTNTGQGRPSSPIVKQPEIIVEAIPCMVQAIDTSSELRVGPGKNRSIILYLSPADTFEVIGTANDSSGLRWWRLDKTKAAPKKAAQVNETWVSDAHMTETGDCDTVGTVAAPRIVRIQPAAAPRPTTVTGNNPSGGNTSSPQSTPQPTPQTGSTDPFVSFYTDFGTFLLQGECITLKWDVRNVKEIYFFDADTGTEKGVTGPTGSQEICPTPPSQTTIFTYELRVVPLSGADIFRHIEVTVDGSVFCPPYPQIIEFGTLGAGQSAEYSVFVEPCGGSATIYIDVIKDSGDMDPYIDVYTNGGATYYGSDDDSGFETDAFLSMIIFEPTEIYTFVANLETTGSGEYTYSVYIE